MANLVRAKISALGTYVPPRLLTNADLEKMVETSNDWIVERTGIRQRHIIDKGMATSDMAIEAANDALKERGMHPGLVWIFSALEPCTTYQPWHDKTSGRTYLRYDEGKCIHYYFYFIDEELGLCYVRVPTWCPFRLQFYCNGHNWLARQLEEEDPLHPPGQCFHQH